MTTIEKAVQWAIETANDNSHGYSQASRYGPDYDCSSFVITAYEQAGLKVKEAGASYTGNMRGAFLACGFVDVTTQVGLSSGYGIQAGDVLLNYSAHTCIAVGGGKVANCRTDEGHSQSGDQSGNEIRIQAYWNFPWNCVLRYKGKEQSTTSQPEKPSNTEQSQQQNGSQSTTDQAKHNWKPETLKYGAKGVDVYVLQSHLVAKNFYANNITKEIDGQYGAKTQAAVNAAQKFYGIAVDGICGPDTWKKLGIDPALFERR